ncbi:MAG TPA: protein-L-isoaspartate O-methyltransferase [Methylophilaceae bacterium]|nr:protein-L-isoaspartate O-methyltransferase [Methylophilaceae bacterium]
MQTDLEQEQALDAREQARFNMIEQQIRTWEVLDGTVLDLLKKIPREDFVPAQYTGLAFADIELPLAHGQKMLSPKMEGRILQALEIKKSDRVLEIGTGSGYLTALLAASAKEVFSVELIPELSKNASERLARHSINNVTLEIGDAANGWPAHAPYDAIVYTGSLPVLPPSVQHSLAIGGRLFVVLGDAPVMEATMIQHIAEDSFKRYVLFETCLPPLINAAQPQRFQF